MLAKIRPIFWMFILSTPELLSAGYDGKTIVWDGCSSLGKKIGSAKTRTKKRTGVAVYNRASSLETLESWQQQEQHQLLAQSCYYSYRAYMDFGYLDIFISREIFEKNPTTIKNYSIWLRY